MKKIIFILVLVAAIGGNGLRAQDTIHLWDMRQVPGYYVPEWLDGNHFQYYPSIKLYRANVQCWGEDMSHFTEHAWDMYTSDTLTVYGIAAGLAAQWRLYSNASLGVTDTSCEFLDDYLRLYVPDSNAGLRHIAEELHVNLRYTPVSYYIDLGLLYDSSRLEMHPPLPMYERYFSTPVTVTDTFYLGRRFRTHHRDGRSVSLLGLQDMTTYGYEYVAQNRDYVNTYGDTLRGWVTYPCVRTGYRFIFPILAPPDSTLSPSDTLTSGYLILHSGNTLVLNPGDTLVLSGDTLVVTGDTLVVTLGDTLVLGGSTFVVNPGDTLFVNPGDTLFVSPDGTVTVNPGGTVVVGSGSGTSDPGDDPGVGLRQADMLYRYTSVAPNPATQRATVTSSFGLERIEVYDPQGRQTLTLPATGYRATLDLSAWPRGTYLLRILTPLGPTTKKLLVQ